MYICVSCNINLYLSLNYVSCYANYMTNSVSVRIFLYACIVYIVRTHDMYTVYVGNN